MTRPGSLPRHSQRRLDLLVAGHTNIDRFLDVPALPGPDRTEPVLDLHDALGGTAANIARAAARAGVRVGLLSRVGEEFPTEYARLLSSEGIDLRGLTRVRGFRSPTCYIVRDRRGRHVALMDQGPMAASRTARGNDSHLAEAGWIHLTTGDPPSQLRLLDAAHRAGTHVAVDPAQEVHYWWSPGPLARLLAGAEILFGNRSEIDRVLELLRIRDRPALLERVPIVVETRGARGAVAWTRAGTFRQVAHRPRRVRHLTGAGDAFRGGFYSGWFSGQPLSQCLQLAVRSAASWIEGRALPRPRPT